MTFGYFWYLNPQFGSILTELLGLLGLLQHEQRLFMSFIPGQTQSSLIYFSFATQYKLIQRLQRGAFW